MDTTQVVIHFIGLVLFTTQVTNDPGLHAILPTPGYTPPKIPLKHHQFQAVARSPEPIQAAVPGSSATSVEQHIAVLIFHKDDLPKDDPANETGWEIKEMKKDYPGATALKSYKYVELTGEHITFIVDAPSNPLAVLPQNMPRFSCNLSFGLASGYQWPYAGAKAVIDIPEGTLSVCTATKPASGRIDTKLVLNTAGTLTVVAVRSGVVKKLVLHTTANPTIYLANVPPARLNGSTTARTGGSHFHVYYDMIEGSSSTCSKRRSVAGAAAVLGCEVAFAVSPISEGPSGRRAYLDVGTAFAVNAECSNTQWP